MLQMLKSWNGKVDINDTQYGSIDEAVNSLKLTPGQPIHIKLYLDNKNANQTLGNNRSEDDIQYHIKVKKWMTQKSSQGFDFMLKWNNDVPMPMRMMTGTVEKETPGMYFMKLHGDMYAEQMCTCMKCGKRLTNKVSQYFGIGPECGGHNYVNPFDTEEELKEAVAQYRKKLQGVTWTGWIAKKAIEEMEEV